MKIYSIDNLYYKQYFAILDIVDNSNIEQELIPMIKRTQLYKKIVYTYLVDKEDEIQVNLENTLTKAAPHLIAAIFPDDLYEKATLIADMDNLPEDVEPIKQSIIDLTPDLVLIDDKAEFLNPIDILSKFNQR